MAAPTANVVADEDAPSLRLKTSILGRRLSATSAEMHAPM